MDRQMKNQRRQAAESFIAAINPYEKQEPLAFDLRRYAEYAKRNRPKAGDTTPETLKKFETGGRPKTKARETMPGPQLPH